MCNRFFNRLSNGIGFACFVLLLWLTPAAPLLAEEPARTLQILSQPTRPAELKSADGAGKFEFLTAETTKEKSRDDDSQVTPARRESLTVSAAHLIHWGHPAEMRADVMLLTTDGSLLAGSPAAFAGDFIHLAGNKLTFITGLFDEVTFPLEMARAVVFQPPADARGRDRMLARLAKVEGAEDLVVLTNGDELSGTIQSLAEGKLTLLRRGPAGKSELELALATPGGSGQVAAIAFNPALGTAEPLPAARVLAGFDDGSLIVAKQLWLDEEKATLLLPGPAKVTLTCDRPAKLVALQPLDSGIRYLSDLAAHSYRQVPYLTLARPYFSDRGATGDRLRSGGKLYNKGLGIPSAARVTYTLDKPYRKLEAELALDDAAGERGSVVCRVYLFAEGAWKPAFESPVIRGGEKPLPISVALEGAKAVTLIVDYADRGDELDFANWLNARLVE